MDFDKAKEFFFPRTTVKSLKKINADLQHSLSILVNDANTSTRTFTGNPYKSSDAAIEALVQKYEGCADWGNQQASSIIDVRAAFIIGQGIKPVQLDPRTREPKETKENEPLSREMEYIKQFIENNDLGEETAQDFAKEGEIEGRFLGYLKPNKELQNIDVRFISYSQMKYKIKTDELDYKKYLQAEWRETDKSKLVQINEPEFVYKRFAGRANKVNDIYPKVGKVLRHMEDLDKALRDLRAINNLFASPTPHFKVENQKAAQKLYEWIKDINWKIGKLLVTNAEFSMVGADAAGIDSLVKEITNLVKIISGATGIPVHFLGLPDLMSNRAVSTDLFEMIIASTNRERDTWVGAYREMFKKVLTMANANFNKSFNVDSIGCDIPQITEKKIQELVDVWLPLYQANVIDLDYFLSLVPNADPSRMKAGILAKAKEDFRQMQSAFGGLDTGEEDNE